jgi:hypothetical protein
MTKKVLVILPAIVLIVVGFYFVFTTSPLVRYWVDDFCSATLLNQVGFWNSLVSTWNGWTGRYSYITALDIFELIGPWVVRILPILLLGLLLASLKRFYRISKILPILFIFLALVNAPNIIQSFYWQTGLLNYMAPFIFLNIFLGLLIFPPKKLNMFLPAILLFIAGGFSESYALTQLVLLFFALTAIKLTNFSMKTDRARIAMSGIIGAVLALGIMLLAPGNAVRATTVGHPESFKFVIVSALYGTKWYLLRMLSVKPFIYSLFFLFTVVLLFVERIKTKMRDLLILGGLSVFAAVFTTMAVIGSGFYSMAIIPPERTLFIAIYMILVCFVVFSFAVVSLILRSKIHNLNLLIWIVAILNLMTSFFLIKSVIAHWNLVRSEVQAYANEFDRVEPTLIDSYGKEIMTIKNIKPVGELDSFTDNKGWVSGCLAGYYKTLKK